MRAPALPGIPLGYRRVRPGHVILKGDLFFNGHTKKWQETGAQHRKGEVRVGETGFDFFYIRQTNRKPRNQYFITPPGYRRLKHGEVLHEGDLCYWGLHNVPEELAKYPSRRVDYSYFLTTAVGTIYGTPGNDHLTYIRRK